MKMERRKPILAMAMVMILAASLVSGCSKKDSKKNQTEDNNAASVTEAVATPEATAEATGEPVSSDQAAYETSNYENTQLGMTIQFKKEDYDKLEFTEGTMDHDDDFKADYYAVDISTPLDGVSYSLATLYVYNRAFDEAELENINPMMIWLGGTDNTTYTILYSETDDITDATQQQQYDDLMNNCISQIRYNITVTGLNM